MFPPVLVLGRVMEAMMIVNGVISWSFGEVLWLKLCPMTTVSSRGAGGGWGTALCIALCKPPAGPFPLGLMAKGRLLLGRESLGRRERQREKVCV